ncbi:hypothetical protein BpHYR1_044125 [Brachionus plicatilis]|uniref:Uncharacterized protein n=1 Tax=Brachionus plicatilis TaxID=10195 RepID=A0A3M7SWS3_BRAPC|nr:hypothetical protein BpHYR1_044125 [Brachionus plicatilis]
MNSKQTCYFLPCYECDAIKLPYNEIIQSRADMLYFFTNNIYPQIQKKSLLIQYKMIKRTEKNFREWDMFVN